MRTDARSTKLRLKLLIWRQPSPSAPGRMVPYDVDGVTADMSFLELLDVLNETLTLRGEDPVAFDSDCREGICGMCGLVISGRAHGPNRGTTVCQLPMRFFKDGDTITVEPWRPGLPGPQRSDCRPKRLRSNYLGRRLRLDERGRRARRERDSGAEERRRRGDGLGGLHRVWRVRCLVQKRVGVAVCRRQDQPARLFAPGPSRARSAGRSDGAPDGRRRLRKLFERGGV